MYKKEIYRFLNAIEVEERRSIPEQGGRPRRERQKPTPEEMDIINRRNREAKARRRMRAHFDIHDYFTTFTFRSSARPPDMRTAKRIAAALFRKLRNEYRKRGYILKWMRNIELGTKGAWHIHAVINRIPDTDLILADAWKYGKAVNVLLYKKGEFARLAAYITKTPKTDPRIKEACYSTSRNLPIPKPKTKKFKRWKKWKETAIPEGYYLDRESYYEGINRITGTYYRTYTLIRLDHVRMPEDRNRLPAKKPTKKKRKKEPGSPEKPIND